MLQTVTIMRDCFSKSAREKTRLMLGVSHLARRAVAISFVPIHALPQGALRLQKRVFWSATWMFWIYCNHSKSIILSTSLLTQPMSADDCSFQISVVIVTVNDYLESTIKKFTKNPKVCTKNHRKRPLDGRERAVWNYGLGYLGFGHIYINLTSL